MSNIKSRKLAYEILREIEERESFSNIALNNAFKKYEVSAIDRGFVTQLVYGVLERKLTLDYYISKFSKTRLKKIHVDILHILRLAVYQIIYLDKTPDSAAVNEAVKLVKKVNFRSSAFVNGVLRQLIRGYEAIEFPQFESNPIDHLAIKYSHNKWIVDLLIKAYGMEKASDILAANIERPHLSVRTNTLKLTRDDLYNELISSGIDVQMSTLAPDGLRIESLNGKSLDRLDAFTQGRFTVQDESSMLVAGVVDPKPGESILDACSAPGGKSTHMAQLMANTGQIIACDVYDHKLDKINENADRLGIDIIQAEEVDGTMYKQEWVEKFDKVLVDAPCSGLGIIRRKPEIKYLKTYEDVVDLSALQYDILTNNAKYVKKEGRLIYSTCTITLEENEQIVNRFLEAHTDYILEGAFTKILPGDEGSDGFFICKIKRLG